MLTLLDIKLPLRMLFSFFEDGINSLIETEGEYDEFIQQLNLPLRSTICESNYLWIFGLIMIAEKYYRVLRKNFYLWPLAPIVDFYEEIAAGLSDDDSKKIRKHVNNEYYNENELKLLCCVLMLDIILKQVKK